jgi:hypothetical protein
MVGLAAGWFPGRAFADGTTDPKANTDARLPVMLEAHDILPGI